MKNVVCGSQKRKLIKVWIEKKKRRDLKDRFGERFIDMIFRFETRGIIKTIENIKIALLLSPKIKIHSRIFISFLF